MFNRIPIIAAGIMALSMVTVQASEIKDIPYTVLDETTASECGDCHMVFPPNRLTAGGWGKIMDNLSNHFGENARLKPKTAEHIKAYLQSKSLDAKNSYPSKLLIKQWAKKGLVDPIRITETPNWTRHHTTQKYKLMSKEKNYLRGSNCIICHKNALRGMYEEFPGLYGLQ